MKNYENIVIFDSGLGEEEVKGKVEEITKIVDKHKGKVKTTDIWGKRIFAYPIKKKREGFYVLFGMELPPESIGALKKELDLKEEILRYFILKV